MQTLHLPCSPRLASQGNTARAMSVNRASNVTAPVALVVWTILRTLWILSRESARDTLVSRASLGWRGEREGGLEPQRLASLPPSRPPSRVRLDRQLPRRSSLISSLNVACMVRLSHQVVNRFFEKECKPTVFSVPMLCSEQVVLCFVRFSQSHHQPRLALELELPPTSASLVLVCIIALFYKATTSTQLIAFLSSKVELAKNLAL